MPEEVGAAAAVGGVGVDERELRKLCQFYGSFPIWDTLRPKLEMSCWPIAILPTQSDIWEISTPSTQIML